MLNHNAKHIILLIDVSFSMFSHIKSFINALNKYIFNLKKNMFCDYYITIGQFNTELNFITECVNISSVPEYSIYDFNIHGTTSMYDAICLTLKKFSNSTYNTELFIISDGDDNSSFLYSKEDTDKFLENALNNSKWKITHCHTDMTLFNVPTINYDINDICNIFDNLKV